MQKILIVTLPIATLVVALSGVVFAQDTASPQEHTPPLSLRDAPLRDAPLRDAPLHGGRSAEEWIGDLRSEDVAERQKAAYALWSLRGAADAGALLLAHAVGDDDAYVRSTAAKALLGLGAAAQRSTVATVGGLLVSDHEGIRREAATLMWRFGPLATEAVTELNAALDSTDSVVRANAAAALGNTGAAGSVASDRLEELAADDEDEAVRKWAGKSFALIDPVAALASDSRRVRKAAIDTWADPKLQGWKRADVREALVAALDDPDEQIRVSAANDLANFCGFARDARPVELIAVFERILEHDRAPAVRAQGAAGLGRFKGHGKRVVPVLAKAAASSEPDVQWTALVALRMMGAEARSAVPVVLRVFESGDDRVRAAAVGALGGLGVRSDAVIDVLIRGMQSRDRGTRRTSISTLGGFGTTSARAVRALVTAFGDESFSVYERAAIAEALATSGAAELAVAPLTQAFETDPDGDPRIAFALVSLDAPIAARALTAICRRTMRLTNPFEELNLLGRLGPKAAGAVSTVAHQLDRDKDRMRLDAVHALTAIGVTQPGVRAALQRAATDPAPDVAQAAKSALESDAPETR